MIERKTGILSQLQPLELLDLSKRSTVSEIVEGMKSCSFGARMLGEAADTLKDWVNTGRKPYLVTDISRESPLRPLLKNMCHRNWFAGPFTTEEFLRCTHGMVVDKALVVGHAEYDEGALYRKCERALYVNAEGRCKPGQVKDGYFPDVVFSAPEVVLPILELTLDERIKGMAHPTADLMRNLEKYGGEAKRLVHGAHTLSAMLCDQTCTMVMSLSGAMTIAKMQLLIDDLINTGRLSFIASTGALMAHGLIEGSGCRHYKYDPRNTDDELVAEGLNRVTDTIEPESNFDHIEEIVSAVFEGYDGSAPISTHQFHHDLGKYLVEHYPEARALLASAFRKDVRIAVPAWTDSELGNDLLVFNRRRRNAGKLCINVVPELDTDLAFEISRQAERMGIFTIGGGVPRNWLQNLKPLEDIHNARLGIERKAIPYFYGCRIDPAPMHFGNLSGCTYVEGVSWGKFDSKGKLAEVHLDATIAWPFTQKFATERYYAQAA